jgi:outer membrane protein TolC
LSRLAETALAKVLGSAIPQPIGLPYPLSTGGREKMRRLGSLAVLVLVALAPTAVVADPEPLHSAPPTLYNLDRKIRFISLAEARATALEQGHAGQPSLLFAGVRLDNLVTAPECEKTSSVHVYGKRGSKRLLLVGAPSNLQPAEFERNINQMLLNVENAYWNLYGSYWQLYSREQGLRLAYDTWKITKAQYQVGRVSKAALAQAEGQYNLFRSQRVQAIDTVLDNERQLRAMLGMKIEDGTRLVPSDAPTLAEYRPDWKTGWYECMQNRPELYMARQDVKVSQLNVQLAKNFLLPDLRSSSPYDSKAIEERLDGSSARNNAFRNLASNTFYDWTVGMRVGMPLGFCFAHTQLRQSQLQLARAFLVLHDQEVKAERFLGLYYRRLSSAYFQIKAAQAQREAFATQLQIRYELYRAGANEPGTGNPVNLNLLLEAQRFWAEALATECQAIVTYNNSLAGWEYAKGKIMKHAHVRLAEEAPSDSDFVRAVELEHKRTRQHVRHEQGVSADSPLTLLNDCMSDAKLVPSLPALWKRFPSLKDAGEVQEGPVERRVSGLN